MNKPELLQLGDLDPEDVSDVLVKIEKSFGFTFGKNELTHTKSFSELCDIVTSKVNLESSDECTTQQAFYKLRRAIAYIQGLNFNDIKPTSNLQLLFPKNSRRSKVRQLERKIGVKLEILRPKSWISTVCIWELFGSLAYLFINWKIGLMGLSISLIASRIAELFGKEFTCKTLRDVAKKMAREHYVASRRNPATINKLEVVGKIKELFTHDLEVEPAILTPDATFY